MQDTKQQWFKDAKFGLFIHWGLYALLAGEYKGKKTDRIAEWIMNDLDIPVEEYEKLAAQFNPVEFDADMIVRKAKEWGMKYIVFTSKHHEGFAMWDSKCSDYNVVKATPYGKDIVRQLREARTDVQNYDPESHMLDTVRSALQGIAMGDSADQCAKNIMDRIAEYSE